MGNDRLAPLWAIRAARLFDGQVLRSGPVLVLVDGERIAHVELTGAPPPSEMEVVDLGDDTLLPGLVDSHVHLCFDPAADPVQQMLDDDSNGRRTVLVVAHTAAARSVAVPAALSSDSRRSSS